MFEILILYPFGLNISAPKKENINAADIPALVTSKIPVITPITPSLFASAKAPFTNELPKLEIGTEAPAPANFIKGSYKPKPPNIAPITTNVLVVWAGVSLNTSIIICAITHIPPPTTKAQKNFSKI